MNSKIFLLITDDPDDYVEFASALDELSTDAIVLSVGNGPKAMRMLEESIFVPHCVMINLLMSDNNADEILSALQNRTSYNATVKIAYGGEGAEFNELNHRKTADFLRSSVPYTELRQRLASILED
jgi:hypothetical protein